MIPKQLRRPEFRFNKVKENKAPLENEWQSARNYTFEEADDFFRYGVVCGYGNLIVIDFDSRYIQDKFLDRFPETFTVRTAGKGLYHLYFICDEEPRTKRINNRQGQRVADIQGKGTFVVGAGTVMGDGKKYTIVKDIPIAKIKYQKIRETFHEYWNIIDKDESMKLRSMKGVPQGQRNELCFKKACSLLARGFDKPDTFDILVTWNQRNKPPLKQSEILTCVDSASKFDYEKKPKPIAVYPLNNYLSNVAEFWSNQPFFYDKYGIFWKWDIQSSRYEVSDDIALMIELDKALSLNGQSLPNNQKGNYVEALKWIGREHIPKEAPTRWVQFKNKAYSLRSGNIYDIEPNYFFCNSIPWEIGQSSDTPTIDKLFKEWVGEKYAQTLHEVIAYCCYTSYPIHLIFCLYGGGRNGKTCFMRLLTKFLGEQNVCATDLDILLSNRFESFKLYKKLMCSMGETNFGILSKSSILKKLVGGDILGFEKKNKDPFDSYNYAKIIIASNSLPSTTDTSEGFYRRWMIIEFPHEFPEGKDILDTIPVGEYSNLARKVIEILPNLLEKGILTNQGDIEERKRKYIMASNPLSQFIDKFCNKSEDAYVSYQQMYTAYLKFLRVNKRRRVRRLEFKAALEDEGYTVDKTSRKIGHDDDGMSIFKNTLWIDGIELKYNWEELCDLSKLCLVSNTTSYIGEEYRKEGTKGISGTKPSLKTPSVPVEQIEDE